MCQQGKFSVSETRSMAEGHARNAHFTVPFNRSLIVIVGIDFVISNYWFWQFVNSNCEFKTYCVLLYWHNTQTIRRLRDLHGTRGKRTGGHVCVSIPVERVDVNLRFSTIILHIGILHVYFTILISHLYTYTIFTRHSKLIAHVYTSYTILSTFP